MGGSRTRRQEERGDREFPSCPLRFLLWQQSSPCTTQLHWVALALLLQWHCSICSHSPGRLMPSLCCWFLSASTSHFCFLNSSQISLSSPFLKKSIHLNKWLSTLPAHHHHQGSFWKPPVPGPPSPEIDATGLGWGLGTRPVYELGR